MPLLCLTRRVGEVVCIGDDVEIEVVKITRSQVQLAIRAPRETAIVRSELLPEPNKEQSNGTC